MNIAIKLFLLVEGVLLIILLQNFLPIKKYFLIKEILFISLYSQLINNIQYID